MTKKLLLILAIMLSAFHVNAANPTVVSIIGDAAGGWTAADEHNMISTDGEHWTYSGLIVIDAPDKGGIKFRAEHDWAINWGAADWPSGTGTQDGKNILCKAGSWDVTFNSTTGEYTFEVGAVLSVVKLVGTAANAVDGLTMATADGVIYTLTNTTVIDGNAQFNLDGAAAGGSGFPSGTVADAATNIPVVAGKYSTISFNISTGEYLFTLAPQFETISLTGDAVGGWGDGHDFDMTTDDGINYSLKGIPLLAAKAKFRQGHAWSVTFGDAAFPKGTSTGNDIVVTMPATYNVSLNIVTGAYNFSFQVVSLTGTAVGGWGTGFDYDLSTADGVNYTINTVTLAEGALKFRLGHAWDTAWGDVSFPNGTAAGHDIAVAIGNAGTYSATFNVNTGVYSFAAPITTIALVGSGTAQGWPSDPQVDANQLTSTDGIHYTLNSIVLSTGAVKFRQNNTWTINGGAMDWPSGTATAGGHDIMSIAGTYSVNYNMETGDYSFGAPVLANKGFSTSSFKVYPNPAQNSWNISTTNATIERIQIVNILGKTVLSLSPKSNTSRIDASNLESGIYFAKVDTATSSNTIKLIKN